MSKFVANVRLLPLLLLLGLAACGGGSMAPRQAAVVNAPQSQSDMGNNTSAADSFTPQSNGNAGASNVSKVSIRSALSIPAGTRIWAHLMVWFGESSHMNVGYDSADPRQIHRQLDDMQSRGIQGAIVDWYGNGPNFTHENTATTNLMHDAATRNGFQFAVMEDAGGGPQTCAQTPGCDVTQQVISDVNYAAGQYLTSPAYLTLHGHPVIFFFGLEQYPVDWNRVRGAVHGRPKFVFRNSGAFQAPQTDGGFSWVNINTADANDWGQSYLDSFYATGLQFNRDLVVGSTYKGFNDSLAPWGANRILNQNCGQTWLSTLDEVGKYYHGNSHLDGVQLVTWNDYEEGTEIESGVENCVSVNAQAAGNTLTWQLSGDEAKVDHYTVYSSPDGQSMNAVVDVPAGTRSVDLSSHHVAHGTTVYVLAVGKPSMINHLSAAVHF